ncbi:hypothetical protein EYF80_049946 [Liparis tanakae]|uniref:Uncharacterized protein n=1 Tax=Liparis tanakae TaxID=230148 RepID=A0A4Z2FGK6_9TELE|nr:hypothetical protein EYF80_049946 [Liparis tanakae]
MAVGIGGKKERDKRDQIKLVCFIQKTFSFSKDLLGLLSHPAHCRALSLQTKQTKGGEVGLVLFRQRAGLPRLSPGRVQQVLGGLQLPLVVRQLLCDLGEQERSAADGRKGEEENEAWSAVTPQGVSGRAIAPLSGNHQDV